MTIKTKSFLQLQRPQNEINNVLQEDISIQIPTLSPPATAKNSNVGIPKSPRSANVRKPKSKFIGIVGIDLGTTNSVVAVIKDGQPVAIPNKEGFLSTPSVVAYTHSGDCLVGQAAKRQAITNPQNTFDSVIRFISCNDEVTEQAKQVSYKVLRDTEGKVKIDCPVLSQQFTPEEILAQILCKLADDASQHLDGQVTQVELTVPAYFNQIQRHAVKEAGRIAGLEVLRIIPQPTAAALAYALNKKNTQTILVFDLGGGHFSISILEVGDGVFEVLAYSGDTQLGGNDFDRKIVDWLAQEFKQLEGIDLRQESFALQRLREAAEKAKVELSNATETEIDLPWIISTASGSKHLKTILTRAKFEELCTNFFDRCRSSVDNAIRDAKIDKTAIDEVILVGGSTRIPAVQEFLRQSFGKEPKQAFNTDESVALGAAIEAGVLAGEVKDILMLDITPLSLGVETFGGVMTKIIPRNTTFPTKKSEVFSTAVDGQTYVEIHVLQGDREMASDNKSLGILRLDGIPPNPRGVPQIEVIFDIDTCGILYVTAKDKSTGKEQSMTITGASSLSQKDKQYTSSELEGTLMVVAVGAGVAALGVEGVAAVAAVEGVTVGSVISDVFNLFK